MDKVAVFDDDELTIYDLYEQLIDNFDNTRETLEDTLFALLDNGEPVGSDLMKHILALAESTYAESLTLEIARKVMLRRAQEDVYDELDPNYDYHIPS